MGNDELFQRLAGSKFRSGFALKEKDIEYIQAKGLDTIRSHAEEFVNKRLAPAYIPNDGKQTPMRGHPIFLAQHATACCCRGCLRKWHRIEPGVRLTEEQQAYVVNVLMEWVERQLRLAGMDAEKLRHGGCAAEAAPCFITRGTGANEAGAAKPGAHTDKLKKKEKAEGGQYQQLNLPFI